MIKKYFLSAITGAIMISVVIVSGYAGNTSTNTASTPNGIVCVGSCDHNVYALNANTGTKVWNYTTGDIVLSSPTVSNGIG